MPPPMSSPMFVASAAPGSPQPNTPTNRKSKRMFATPAATMTRKPYLGLPAVTKKLWKAYCKMKNGSEIIIMRP